ncbi:vanadium-dependent haloperoxidase [Streptomyces sp. WMMC500]|uniref:vanadium-dependent haloperoxidase n=1 Tax=Streptomyces sp. WMMC500 TaxID=3015154 RepID=UPI00248B68B9|nr:vanadium-dependent haloperoxidase [Streptomyces sp. WMMC500]WBB62403.1 vanadium-dependent haloperoxidase [Streptomyces sp. WMMC500]
MATVTRLRNRRLGYAVAIATAAALTGTLTSAVPASSQDDGFDIDRDNVLMEVVYPKFQRVSRDESSGRAVSLTVDHAMLIEMPWFDAIAPYHPTAKGIFSDIPRRPESEHTTRNQNIAVTYAAFTSLNALLPEYKDRWIEMMEAAGLDPNATAEDPATPSGIGILAAKTAMAARQDDGSNRDGGMGGRKYHKKPYADYTGYRPVNSVYELRNPSRWQPNTSSTRDVYKNQQFATPYYGRVKPFTYDSPREFKVSPPVNSNHHNHRAYKRQADEVLRASASLTDEQKMAAELFNDKVLTFGQYAGTPVVLAGNLNTEQTVHYITMSDVAFVDVTIATWYYKRKFDSVRPGSAVDYLYGDRKVTAWGGPGQGTVDDITGGEWQGYLDSVSADHPEYPSASSALCLAFAAQVRQFTGTDQIKVTAAFPKGSSLVEPGVTPAADITLQWNSWTEFAEDCGESRIWAGENFRSSVEAAEQYAPEIGDMSYEFVQRKVNGG